MKRPRIIVSNGFGQFPLRLAAAEMASRDVLAAFITGGYPTPTLARRAEAAGLVRIPAMGRFLARAAPVPAGCVHALWAGEPFSQVANRVRGASAASRWTADRLHLLARGLYAAGASRILRRLAPARGRGIYHYRSGFGGASVDAARRRGWLCLCDHTIAHPAVLEYLVAHAGRLPPAGESGPIDRNWRAILADVDRADHVLTRSDFVKSTFVHQGWDGDKIDVIYPGIADEFLSALPERTPSRGPLRLLFAGSFGRRKGGLDLAEAMSRLDDVDWRLDLCGQVEPGTASAFGRLAADPRVTYHGMLPLKDLAARMAVAEVFVFPTLADDSARVVWEALAAGCYVVTTANAGTIVADGEHGRLIAPGSPRAIADALRHAAGERAGAARIGARNAALVRRSHRQADYGTRLLDRYERLLRG